MDHSHHQAQGHHDHGVHPPGHGDKPDVHGMLVVGEGVVYLSHLPMFGHPHHDFQVILEVKLTDPANAHNDLQLTYARDRQQTGERVYTLAPKPFVLSELASSDPEQPPRREFLGTLFRGHFEKGGQPLFEVRVHVNKVTHFRQFDPAAQRPDTLDYLLFGRGQELFLAHLITAPPDFDQVVPVTVHGHVPSDDDRRDALWLTIRDRGNTAGQRLQEQDSVVADVRMTDELAPRVGELRIEAGRELYFEEGELRSPATFAQTAEEKSAGF